MRIVTTVKFETEKDVKYFADKLALIDTSLSESFLDAMDARYEPLDPDADDNYKYVFDIANFEAGTYVLALDKGFDRSGNFEVKFVHLVPVNPMTSTEYVDELSKTVQEFLEIGRKVLCKDIHPEPATDEEYKRYRQIKDEKFYELGFSYY